MLHTNDNPEEGYSLLALSLHHFNNKTLRYYKNKGKLLPIKITVNFLINRPILIDTNLYKMVNNKPKRHVVFC